MHITVKRMEGFEFAHTNTTLLTYTINSHNESHFPILNYLSLYNISKSLGFSSLQNILLNNPTYIFLR